MVAEHPDLAFQVLCLSQIIDLRLALRHLGVPVCRSAMFGNNESVVTSGSIPHSQLNKRWTALSYHRCTEGRVAHSDGGVRWYLVAADRDPLALFCIDDFIR